MILSIAERSRSCAGAVGCQAKTNRILLHFNPDMAASYASSPFKEEHRIVFVEAATAFELIFVDGQEHLRQAALSEDTPRILTNGFPLAFGLLGRERGFCGM
jgi:hypothetical protein